MSTLFFFYDVVILMVCMLAASMSVCAFFVSHRRTYLAAASFFAAYLLETALIFMDEYTRTKPVNMTELILEMPYPWLKFAFSVLLITSAWALVLSLLERLEPKRLLLPVAVVAVAQALPLALIADENTKQLIFWNARTLALLAMLIYLSVGIFSLADDGLRRYLWGYRFVVLAAFVLVLGILLEDTTRIEFGAGFNVGDELYYYLVERNIFENLFVFLLAGTVIRVAGRTLSLRFKEPPVTDSPRAQQAAELRFDHFCTAHGLTARERDILNELLAGKDNQTIATELVVSVGTVKAHVHAVFKKSGVSSRQELLQRFWQE